ncbi:N-acetylmuramoyl-L-alanine amidase [Chitinophaga costaii]|nr:N-acetylmuramoyl-L-alanine amidase [Chitinophaga costaii]
MKRLIQRIAITVILGLSTAPAFSQAGIFLVQGNRERYNVSNPRQFLSGHVCRDCRLWLNNDSLHVYPTGSFATVVNLQQGENTVTLRSEDPEGHSILKSILYYFTPTPAPVATSSLRVETINIMPSGNLWLSEGDTLRIRMKGYPGCQATWINEQPLQELPASRSGGIPGYYEGAYIIQATDSLLNNKLKVVLRDPQGSTVVKESAYRYRFLPGKFLYGRTIDNRCYLTTSPVGDRLGPEKLEYLDQDVLLRIVGRVNDYYKVKLSPQRYAYIPEPLADTASSAAPVLPSQVGSLITWSDVLYDYAAIQLSEKLPYASTQQVAPGRISIDVFGANLAPGTTYRDSTSTREITHPFLQQAQPDVVRITLPLQHAQPWGYKIYYEGTRLIVLVKRPPPHLDFAHLTIGIDAGHGGSNPGSMGPTGMNEKNLTLQLALALRDTLAKRGATLLMTRTRDESVNNEDRFSNFRNRNPDLLVSIHLNSSANPVDVKGSATYYKQPMSEPLGSAVHEQLLQTGLRDFKNNGHFNFVLVQPTEFPSLLIETLFISNPDDETLVLDPSYRQLLVDKMVQGLQNFLDKAAKNQ